MDAEGWFRDPYGRYEARWISAGTPTALVRSGGVESQDPPPDQPFTGELQPLDEDSGDADDLRRADEAEAGSGYDPDRAARAEWDTFDQTSGD